MDSEHIIDVPRITRPTGVLPANPSPCASTLLVSLINYWEESRLATPEQLLESALILTSYEASWAPLRGGDQVLANIRQFVGMATRSWRIMSSRMNSSSISTSCEMIWIPAAPQAALDAVDAVRFHDHPLRQRP